MENRFFFLGKRTVFWLVCCSIAGLGLAIVEFLFSASIVVVLQLIGLIASNSAGSFFSKLSLITTENAFLVLILLGFAKAFLHVFSGISAVASGEIFISRLKVFLVQNILKKDSKYLDISKVGSLFSESFPKASHFVLYTAQAIAVFFQLIAIVAILSFTSLNLTLIGACYLLVVGAVIFLIQKKVQRLVAPMPAINEKLFEGIFRLIKNWFLIRIYQLESEEEDRNRSLIIHHASKNNYSHFLSMLSVNIPNALGIGLIVIFMIIHQRFHFVSNDVFVSFLYLFLRFVQLLSQLTTLGGVANVNYPYFRDVKKYFQGLDHNFLLSKDDPAKEVNVFFDHHFKTAAAVKSSPTSVGEDTFRNPPAINIKDIHFQYPGSTEKVFNGLNISIKPGQQLVITGESGSGKSTLLAIILGMLNASSGMVELDDIAAQTYFKHNGQHVGYAGVDPFLIDGTIKDNLLYGNKKSKSDEQISGVLKSLGLHGFIETLPLGINTLIDERGSRLSTGQKQRLSIARSLLREPVLLILDEVSANLDDYNEKLLVDSIAKLKGRTTVIVVTHRHGMAANADVTVNLQLIKKNKEVSL